MNKNKHNSRRLTLLILGLLILAGCQPLVQENRGDTSADDPQPQVSVAIPTTAPTVLPTETVDSEKAIAGIPLAIASLRAREYPASELVIEQTLEPGANYQRHIASYLSDGFRIYGLLTVPDEAGGENGHAAILFLHGYIPPDTYITTRDYVATQDALASSGFLTFKPDMRGHGISEGEADGAHFSETYIVDTLNALSALENDPLVDAERIGIWGHSNGGLIGLRTILVTDRVKAASLWAGVVGSYEDMLETFFSRIDFLQRLAPPVVEEFGLPSENPDHWSLVDPFEYLDLVTTPVQLHHGVSDGSVPVELSRSLNDALLAAGKNVELYEYPGQGHNFYGEAFTEAMRRTIEFFNLYL
jgi:dipeptidyl aminopeptidase/acylaminoacyl peptidase